MTMNAEIITRDTPSPIRIDLSVHGDEGATHMWWISDDRQRDMDGGRIDGRKSLIEHGVLWARELVKQGHDGSGHIYFT